MTTEVMKFTQTSSPFLSTPNKKEGVVEIEGYAVHVGTFNMITLEKEELDKSVASLIGQPILKNHHNNVDVVIGKITDAYCEMDQKCGEYAIKYTAEIDEKEEDLIRKMELDFVSSVSVGFRCKHVCSICGEEVGLCSHWFWDDGFQVLAQDIIFHELSIVAVPADLDATVKVNFADKSNQLQFEKLEEFKREKRRTLMSDLEAKYDDMVDKYNELKMSHVDEVNSLKEEFKATKEKLEADKADEMKKALEFKAEVDALKLEKEELESKLASLEDSFKAIEEEKLSALRERVTELNAEVFGDLTEEEINSFEEATLNRYVQTFEHIASRMVKVSPTKPHETHKDEYKAVEDENVSLAEKLTGQMKNIRGH